MIEIDCTINEPPFAEACAKALLSNMAMAKANKPQQDKAAT